VRHRNLRLWFEREESDDSLQIASQVLGIDRPRWQYFNLPVDHGSVIREVDVIPAQVEVIAEVVEGLASSASYNSINRSRVIASLALGESTGPE
jgi:hypothetical protein